MSVTKRTPIADKIKFSIIPSRAKAMKLHANDWQTLAYLGSISNRYGVCFPTQEAISKYTGLTQPQVKAAIIKIVKAKLVRRLKTKHRHGLKAVGRYQVLCLADDQPMPTKEEEWEPVGYQRRQLWGLPHTEEGSRENKGEERRVKAAASRWVRAIEEARGVPFEAPDQHRHIRSAIIDRGMTEYEIVSRTTAWLNANPGRIPASAEVTLKAIA
tara:strand:- start:202 stop:843 length:642 start_codon:yes stop_codon:yes gene_type:complete